MKFQIPYHKKNILVDIDDNRINGVMTADEPDCSGDEIEIIKKSMINPIASDRLCNIAKDKESVLVITSDHTRPVPSKITMPLILSELRENNPNIDITIIIATGSHRPSTEEELIYKFGKEIVDNESIVMHISTNNADMVYKGKLPSGLDLYVNKLVDEVDLIIAEGFIEPHFFAGFSGGRKSVLPGIASLKSVLENHCSEFVGHPNAKTGSLNGNPMHEDMVAAAKLCGLKYILNVIIDDEKRVIYSYAGCAIKAHEAGCSKVSEISGVKAIMSDIVVTSNGGYPLDQNVYQAVKGLTTGEVCVSKGGVIIMFSSCCDGHGGQELYNTFVDHNCAKDITTTILATKKEDTIPDQWEAQMLARVQEKATVIVVSCHVDPQLIRDMKMLHAKTFDEALNMADEMLNTKSKITVIPDGVKVIPL